MSCDAELQELMIQVDRMVEEKKVEWQDKIKNTENKLQNTLHENYSMRSIIEDKNAEIDSLKTKIRTRESIPTITEYDQEVLQLRLELSEIKKSYEKYHYKYVKRAKEIEKEKEDLYKEKIDLLKQLNDYKNQQHQWNQERSKYQIQIEESEAKKQEALSERSLLSEQLKSLKAELTHQMEIYSESERCNANNTRDMEQKLLDSKNHLQREIEDNRNKLCELMQHTKRTLEEKQQLINDNESAKRMIIRLENELGKVISDNKFKEKTIYKYEQTIKMSEKAINEKNEVIKALQLNSSPKDYSSLVSKLENELLEAKTSMKLSKKNEKSLQFEVLTLDNKLKEARDVIELEQNKRKHLSGTANQVPKLEEEKTKLISQIEQLEGLIETRTTELNGVKNHLESMTLENEKLKQSLNQESINAKKNCGDHFADKKESRTRTDNASTNQRHDQRTLHIMEKERSDLLKFCEDKDMVIQRLQMENRILQEFITKLNVGLSDETVYIPAESNFDEFMSVSDVFQPLKETFLEYNDGSVSNYNKPVQQIFTGEASEPQMLNGSVPSQQGQLHNSVYRSSEEFLSLITQKDSNSRGDSDRSGYMNLYPTLTAAKYFTDEREKTKQIEQIIDLHMTQLRLETDKKCHH